MQFHRLFSKTMYKNLKLPLGEMIFTKDFINDTRGDLYPLLVKSADCMESVENNTYVLSGGSMERMLGQFFPYATYETTFSCSHGGSCGFSFHIPDGTAFICYDGQTIVFTDGNQKTCLTYACTHSLVTLIVSCRPGAFDVYFEVNGQPQFVTTFETEVFARSNCQEMFQKGYVSVLAQGSVTLYAASFYIDCGISQADIRPIRYENGDVMMEDGKIYLTLSIRMQEKTFQGIVSWIPGTSSFALTGALFYDAGDGVWNGDVAASILFHRPTQEWYLWVCSFSHGHILGHASFTGDPRFGVNVVDITFMSDGVQGDEDPDFYYDAETGTWYLAICRLDSVTHSYKYVFYKSSQPFEGYTYIGCGQDGAETGGSFVTIDDEKVFICGNSFEKRSDYRIYSKSGLSQASFDFPDNGFRGWGTVIPVSMGSRNRYFWLTFDRHNGSAYNWSYGNVYCFELMKSDEATE